MERSRLHAADSEHREPCAQLAGGACREGHGEDLGRRHGARGDAVRDPVGDGAGLAGAGSGENSHGAFERLRDLALLRVESRQHRLGVAHRTSVIWWPLPSADT
jgi:hypothetical protein